MNIWDKLGRGVEADLNKIKDMLNWPVPKDMRGLRGFLGLARYYRKFVNDYGKIAWSLTQQLKKDNFAWDEAAQGAFEKLKTTMTTLPVLAVPDFVKTFVVESDASGKGKTHSLYESNTIQPFSEQVGI